MDTFVEEDSNIDALVSKRDRDLLGGSSDGLNDAVIWKKARKQNEVSEKVTPSSGANVDSFVDQILAKISKNLPEEQLRNEIIRLMPTASSSKFFDAPLTFETYKPQKRKSVDPEPIQAEKPVKKTKSSSTSTKGKRKKTENEEPSDVQVTITAQKTVVVETKKRRKTGFEEEAKLPGSPEELKPRNLNADFLQPQGSRRYVVFPIQYPQIRKWFETQRDKFWTQKDVDIGPDKDHFKSIKKTNPIVAETLLNILGFFAASDGLILENLGANFQNEVAIIECRQFYAMQAAIESIHSDMYSLLIDRYVESIQERRELFESLERMEAVRIKAEWAKKWLDPARPFEERLVAMTVVEGIHFSSSFGFIFWVKDHFPGMLPGLMTSNLFISRDENFHAEHGIELFNMLPFKIPLSRVKEIYQSGMETEIEFLQKIMPGVPGLSTARMVEHIKYTTNYYFAKYQPEGTKIETVAINPDGSLPEPLPEIRKLAHEVKSSFFEQKNVNYVQPKLDNQRKTLA